MIKFSVVLGVAILFGFESRGEMYFVNTTNDTITRGSLRGAIINANARGKNNTIVLTQNRYVLTLTGADENAGYTGDLDVTNGNLTILGFSHSHGSYVTIDATGLGDRVFKISPRAHLTLENIVITGGSAPNYPFAISADGENGGGIYNAGTLTLDHCLVIDNSSGGGYLGEVVAGSGGDGGGIYNLGSFSASSCTISNNLCGTGANGGSNLNPFQGDNGGSGGHGGGIFNGGRMVMTDCDILSNTGGAGGLGGTADNGGAGGNGGSGGGICNTNQLALNYCIVAENTDGAGGSGGDSDFQGNGGGIVNLASGANITLFNSLIAWNSFGSGGDGGAGGNFYSNQPPGLVGTPGSTGSGSDLLGAFASLGYNLVREADGSSGLVNGVKHDVVGTIAAPANAAKFKFLRHF